MFGKLEPDPNNNQNHIIEGDFIMKFISWNVNGLRACINKGFMDFF